MNLLAPVSSIMQTNVITASENDDLWKVAQIMQKYKIHHVMVVDGRKLIGVVSSSDVLLRRNHENLSDDQPLLQGHLVKDVMTTGLGKLEPTDRINVALNVFKENMFHALPVVEEGELVGVITTFDFIKHLDEDEEIIESYRM